ncbi:unnamed protein product, partial [Mesorhabditis spiculigera]
MVLPEALEEKLKDATDRPVPLSPNRVRFSNSCEALYEENANELEAEREYLEEHKKIEEKEEKEEEDKEASMRDVNLNDEKPVNYHLEMPPNGEPNGKDKKRKCSSEDVLCHIEMLENRKEKSGSDNSRFGRIRALYGFADRIDYQLMFVAIFCVLIQSILPPFVWLLIGKFVNAQMMIEVQEVRNQTAPEDVPNISTTMPPDPKLSIIPANEANSEVLFLVALGLAVSLFFVAFFQRLAWEFSAIRQVFRVKKAYIMKLLNMDVSWLESRQSGQVASMLHDNADNIYNGIADNMPQIMFTFAFVICTLSVCFWIQWDVTLVIIAAVPLLVIVRIIFSKWFCKNVDEENNLHNKMTNLVNETFACIRTVISFAAQKQTIFKFERLTQEHNNLVEQRLRTSSVFDSLAQVLVTELMFTIALAYGMYRVGSTQAGLLSSLAINMLYVCVTSITIGFHLNGASQAKKNAVELREILQEEPLIEKEKTISLRGPSVMLQQKWKRDNRKGKIEFRELRFTYPSRPDIEVLKGLTFTVNPGEHVAIVGPSGSGKSTLTALLLRFYDPTDGEIRVDGKNLRFVNPFALRAECSLVSQEPVLFDGTISDNIRYGRLDATQAEINEAARKVGAWSFIAALPEGMQTRVGDRGVQLSGGQKQRVAIARAVLRDPTVLIFDEATSALDNKHEEEVQASIEAASVGISSITIAHRLTTIRNADRIIVLDGGRIVEEGSPDDLLANQDGIFSKMYNEQRLDQIAAELPPQKPADLKHQKFSFTPADLKMDSMYDPETRRRAWARSSLGAHKKLGKSYSVHSRQKEKLAQSIMSRKKTTRFSQYSMNNNFIDADIDDEGHDLSEERPLSTNNDDWVDTDSISSATSSTSASSVLSFFDLMALPGKASNLNAVWTLIKSYRAGWKYLIAAIPITAIRAFFYLLICFELPKFLELAVIPEEKRSQAIFITAAIFIALIIVKTMFDAMGRLFIALYGHGFCKYMRSEMFRSLLRHGAAYFDEEKNSPGRLVHKVINDTNTLDKIVGQKLDMLIPAFLCSVIAIVVAACINWQLTLICGFQFPAFFIFRVVQLKEGAKRQRQMIEEEKKAANLATVVLSNMSTIKAYSLQTHFYHVFLQALEPVSRAMKKQSIISAFVYACQYSFAFILIAITMHFGIQFIRDGKVTPGDYLRIMLLTQFGANFFSQLIASVSDLSKARIAAENILNVIKEKAVDMDNLSEEGLRPKLEGSIRLQNVSFRYPSRPIIPILQGLTFNIPAGQSAAIVGPSGSGKSSIFGLLQRMYTPNEGIAGIDKYNVRSINPAYLRRVVVSVGQEPTLFSFTIRENIAYGLDDREAPMTKIVEAAKVANIHDFISSLPQGYETEVGEFGAQLSGGQKQRIAIARAIVRDPVILLLDEATAALDSTSEKHVQAALENLSRTCTCVQIAHRLSSIQHVDKIFVVVEGAIVEEGNHAELMETRGIYYEMTQSSL